MNISFFFSCMHTLQACICELNQMSFGYFIADIQKIALHSIYHWWRAFSLKMGIQMRNCMYLTNSLYKWYQTVTVSAYFSAMLSTSNRTSAVLIITRDNLFGMHLSMYFFYSFSFSRYFLFEACFFYWQLKPERLLKMGHTFWMSKIFLNKSQTWFCVFFYRISFLSSIDYRPIIFLNKRAHNVVNEYFTRDWNKKAIEFQSGWIFR